MNDDYVMLNAAQWAAQELGYNGHDASLGKWTFRGDREVFVQSTYIGRVTTDGEFINDRKENNG
jgi:hypothetical protein